MTPPALFIPISDPVLLAVLVTLPDLISTLLTVPYESPKRPWYPDDASMLRLLMLWPLPSNLPLNGLTSVPMAVQF